MFNHITPLNINIAGYSPSIQLPDQYDINEIYPVNDLYPYVEHAFNHYEEVLVNAPKVWDWFKKRKIDINHPLISQYRLGFADRSLCKNFSRDKGRQAELFRGALQRLGILKPNGRQYFHGDVIFPFFDSNDRITGAYGRRISSENRENSIYHHHWFYGEATFFNQKALEDYKSIILCKSPIEALLLICAGIPNVIATMGLFSFGQAHLIELESYKPAEVVLAFDNTDVGNHTAGLIAQALSSSDIYCSRLTLPRNQDIGEFVQRHDNHNQALIGLVNEVIPFEQSFEKLKVRH